MSVISHEEQVLSLADDDTVPETAFLAVQCLEACIGTFSDAKRQQMANINKPLDACTKIFLKYLLKDKISGCDDLLFTNVGINSRL